MKKARRRSRHRFDRSEPHGRQRATCGRPPTRSFYNGNTRHGLLNVHAYRANSTRMSGTRRRIPRSAALLRRESTCALPDSFSLGTLLWRLCLHAAVFVSAFAYRMIRSRSIAQLLAHDKVPASKNRELKRTALCSPQKTARDIAVFTDTRLIARHNQSIVGAS